ncbi:hypothetical protein ACX1C1_01010 [Paenibacillus sp. strain BS8-2]
MRVLLVCMLLLITAMILYSTIVTGEDGIRSRTDGAGSSVSDYIRGMSP